MVVPVTRSFPSIGTTALVAVTDPEAADTAEAMLRSDLEALDATCSRFRPDAEIARLEGADGLASDLLYEAVVTALDVARMTDGAVDPTVGAAIRALGYDRDYAALPGDGAPSAPTSPAPGWWQVTCDRRARTLAVPAGVRLDLGSSAKAWAADRAALRIAAATGSGVLVSLGGDVAVAGPAPAEGWAVGVARSSSAPLHLVDQVVTLASGGLASSSPGARSWLAGGVPRHHVIDPATGESAAVHWTLVSVAAPTCVTANAYSTAALVWGAGAVHHLASTGLAARLVALDGEVVTMNGWPAPDAEPATSGVTR